MHTWKLMSIVYGTLSTIEYLVVSPFPALLDVQLTVKVLRSLLYFAKMATHIQVTGEVIACKTNGASLKCYFLLEYHLKLNTVGRWVPGAHL